MKNPIGNPIDIFKMVKNPIENPIDSKKLLKIQLKIQLIYKKRVKIQLKIQLNQILHIAHLYTREGLEMDKGKGEAEEVQGPEEVCEGTLHQGRRQGINGEEGDQEQQPV